VGEEITRMIAQQKNLEQRFEELVSAQHQLRHLPNKSKLRENQVGRVFVYVFVCSGLVLVQHWLWYLPNESTLRK